MRGRPPLQSVQLALDLLDLAQGCAVEDVLIHDVNYLDSVEMG